jgi:hypothetical protein
MSAASAIFNLVIQIVDAPRLNMRQGKPAGRSFRCFHPAFASRPGPDRSGEPFIVVTIDDVGIDACRRDGGRGRRSGELFGDGDLPSEFGEPAQST